VPSLAQHRSHPTPGYNRAWRLRTVLPLLKRAPEAGDRGTFLTVYEVQTDDVEKLLAERSKRIAAAVQAAPAPFGPIVKGMKELSAIAYKALTGVMTRANTPPAPFGNKVLYRARFAHLSANAASSACARLNHRQLPCVVVPPNHS